MVAMPRHRSAAAGAVVARAMVAAALSAVTLGACAPAGSDATPSTPAPADTTTTVPVWVGGPQEDLWWALDEVCHTANDTALADAREVLTLSTTPDPPELAGYYRRRADQLDALAEELATLTPPTEAADRWTSTLTGLSDYAAWARVVADAVEADGLDADQTPHPGLEAFRTLMPFGACHVLLDVN